MHILKLSAYCFPEQEASSHLADDLNEAYEKADFYLDNFVPMPTRGVSDEVRASYKKKKLESFYNGHLTVHRFSMFREGKNPIGRAIRYVLVNLIQYWKGIHAKDIDVVFSGSTPPTQGMLCALVKKRLTKKYKRPVSMVFAIQDIFPDSLVTAGMTHKGSLIWKLGRKMEDFSYRSADKIITISQSMKRNIMEKGVPEEKIVVVSNWIDVDAVSPVAKEDNPLFEEFGISAEKFTVLYAGNMGAAQGADVILQAAERLKEEEGIQFVIFGGGAAYAAAAEAAAELPNVWIHPLLPLERVSQVYSLGDTALITCKKGVGAAGMPSKTWSIMACNTPIIASFDTDSDLSQVLQDAGAGVCVPPEDPDALTEAIRLAYVKWQDGGKEQTDSRAYVMQHAEKTVCVQKYVETIQACAGTLTGASL